MFKDFSWGTALSVAVGLLVVGLIFFGLHWLMTPNTKPADNSTGTDTAPTGSTSTTTTTTDKG